MFFIGTDGEYEKTNMGKVEKQMKKLEKRKAPKAGKNKNYDAKAMTGKRKSKVGC